MSSLAELERFRVVAGAPNGVQRLRELVLQLAVQGKLVPQDPTDEPASELLKRIAAEKERLIGEGKIKRQKPLPAITEEEKPFELPKGWEWVRLGDLASKIGAGSTPLGGQKVYVSQGVKFLRSQNIWNNGLVLTDVALIPYDTHNKMASTWVEAKDLLFNITGASIGRCSLVPDDFDTGNVSQHVTIIRPFLAEIRHYLHIILISPYTQKLVMDVQVGVSREGLSIAKLASFLVPLPPVEEHKKILEKVYSLLALCDQLEVLQSQQSTLQASTWQEVLNAITQASSTFELTTAWQRLEQQLALLVTEPEQVKGLRDTILQLAVQGKLVPQDPNDEPASVLLTKIQAEKERLIKAGKIKRQKPLPPITDEEKPFELPKGWEWVRLQDILALVTDGDHQPPPKAAEGVPFLVIGNLNTRKISFKGCRYVSSSYYESLDWGRKPRKNDILYTVTGSYGIAIFVDTDVNFCVQRHVAILKATAFTPKDYLITVLASKYAFDYATSVATGIAQKTVSLSGLRTMPIPLPSATETVKIMQKVNALISLCDQLEARLQAARQTQAQFALETVNNLSTQ